MIDWDGWIDGWMARHPNRHGTWLDGLIKEDGRIGGSILTEQKFNMITMHCPTLL